MNQLQSHIEEQKTIKQDNYSGYFSSVLLLKKKKLCVRKCVRACMCVWASQHPVRVCSCPLSHAHTTLMYLVNKHIDKQSNPRCFKTETESKRNQQRFACVLSSSCESVHCFKRSRASANYTHAQKYFFKWNLMTKKFNLLNLFISP